MILKLSPACNFYVPVPACACVRVRACAWNGGCGCYFMAAEPNTQKYLEARDKIHKYESQVFKNVKKPTIKISQFNVQSIYVKFLALLP